MTLNGTALNEGDKVNMTNKTIDLGTIELRDDNLNETDEVLDEISHALESAEYDNSTRGI